jgi:hypothetical protein
MTAAAKDINTPQYGVPDEVFPSLLSFPVAAATTIYAGTMVATDASGNAVPATASTALKLWGRAEKQVVNTVAAGFGAAGDLSIEVRAGVFYMNNGSGAQAITNASRGSYCYAVDDNVAGISNAAGTLPLAGVIFGLGVSGVNTGKVAVGIGFGFASPYSLNPALLASTVSAFRARNVAAAGNVASLAAFTVAGNDGVTNVAGDIVVLLEQTTTAQNGPYVVGTVAAGAAPLTRPDWWATGSTLYSGTKIRLGGEGTVFKNADLRAFVAADSFVVGTTDPKLYPESVSGATALASGTFTISTVPIFGANSTVHLERKATGGTVTSTIGYHPTTGGATGITAGVRGTAAAIIEAAVAAGTINTADTSTLHWTVINQA